MKTNLLSNLSNGLKKRTGLTQVGYRQGTGKVQAREKQACGRKESLAWSPVELISDEGAIEHPLITHSAPFGIRWKPAGEKGSTRVWKHVAMIFAVLVMSMANIGMAWGADYTIALTSLTESPTGTYTKEGLGGLKCKNYTNILVEVPSASASGTVSWLGSGAADDRFLYIYKTNGTVKDETRKIVYAKSYGSVDFTSSDIKTSGGKYYLVFGTTDDWKAAGVKYTLAAPSCTAPNHVDVTGRWDRFAGETISLTATAYSSAGTGSPIAAANITGYQWEKLVGTTWTALSNGTTDGVTTSGATTANLQIANCKATNSGKYRCVVSTGATCSTASATATDGTQGLGVKVFILECYNDGTKTCSFTRTGDTQTGTATLTLAANTAYTFKFHVDNVYYGNNASINEDITNYVFCNSDNGGNCASNFTINSGLGGTFTLGIDYSTGGNSNVEGEPELSVTYPRKTIYLTPGVWNTGSAKFAFYYFRSGGSSGWTDFLTSNDCGMSAEIPQWNGVKVNAVRLKNTCTSPNWDDKWNQTSDITISSNNSVVITDWGSGDSPYTYGTYATPTYTISYNAGTGGSGSKASESKTCGVDFTLPSSAVFTRTGYTQTGWTTSDGAAQTHALGGSYTTNAAQTFYPVWTVNQYTVTHTLDGVTKSSGATGANAATYGTNYTAEFAASSGYALPETITVTIGGSTKTAGTEYTWNQGTGTVTITGSYITGNIVITITGESDDPCSEPAEVTNEIARFFVPCGLSNATSGSPSAWDVTNQDASTDDNTFTTSGFGPTWYRNATSGLIYGKLNGNGSYIQLELKSGNFQAGDVVTIYINRDNSTKHGLKLKNQSTGNTISISSTASGVEASGTYTIVAADIEADGSLKFFREGSSSYVNRIIVTRPACTNVSITTQPTTPVAATVGSACSITGLVAAGTSPTYQWYTCNSDGSGAAAITSAGAMSFTGYTSATLGLTPTAAGATYYKCIVSGSCGDPVTSNVVTVNASAAETPIITWEMKLTSGQNWGLNGDPSTTDNTNITSISANNTHAAQLDGKTANGTMTAGCTTAQNGTARDNNIYVEFKFHVGCDKKLTPSKISLQVSNIGGSSDGNMTYDAILTDGTRTVSGSVTPASDGTLTTLEFTNADASKYMQGDVTLRVYPYNNNGGNTGSGFRMGQYVKIFGEIANQATPAATITWNTQPANGRVGDPDFAYDVTCSDGSAVTVTSANTTYATIVGGKLHYAAAGTTHLVASATDACGNVLTPVNSNDFTVTVPVTYSITYDCDGAESGCPSNVAAATNLPNPLPSAPTKDGYDFVGWYTNSTKTVAAVAGAALSENTTLYAKWTVHSASECITIAYFETTAHNNSSSKPDNAGKYIYGYTNSAKTEAYAYTITSSTGDNKGQGTGESDYLRMNYGTTVTIYADNTTTSGTPASFSNVTSVSVDFKMMKSSYYTSFDIYVGSTKIANNVSLEGAAQSAFTTFTYDNLEQLSGTVRIVNKGSGSSNFHFYVDNIQICTADMAACTTPTLPTATLSNQNVCPGNDIAEWDATPTNASTITGKGESVSYSWKKKGSETVLGTSATLDLGSTATESQSGTYVVTVTVSKAGYTSVTVSKEVTLTVTAAVEEPVITSNKATVYAGNSVTLTATCGTAGVTWQWYTCTNAAGDGESSIGGATSASYAITSAPAAGTYYYKAKATGSCASASAVYTLTVSAPSECENYYWFVYAADATTNGVVNNRDGFFSNTSTGDGNTGTYKMMVDGIEMTATKRLSTGAYKPKFTVPTGSTATLYVYGKAASADAGKHLVLKRTSDNVEVEVTNNTTVQGYTKENIEAGEWTLSCGSSNWCYSLLAVKVCSASSCTDATPTIAAVNNTVCSGTKMKITATGYETGATFKWQKLNGSAWEDIAGETKDSLVINPAAAANAGSYRFIATKGCARTSNTVTIAVPGAPVFGAIPASVSVMQTLALSISTVEASDAVSYKWYKSTNNTLDASDPEIGDSKNLIKAYDGEAIASPAYYVFCIATNSCGADTTSAIAINVTAYVEQDCATRGNEGEAEFEFDYGSAGQGSYSSTACWTMNSNSKFLTYTAPEGKYFKTAKVTIASSSESRASYNWSTDGGSTYTAVALTVNSTLTERTINLSAHGNVDKFQIGRNFNSTGSSNGTLYVSKICFEYIDACTATRIDVSDATRSYNMSGDFTEPTFTLKNNSTGDILAGTLTYHSSNEDIAEVDDKGDLSFNGKAGVVTITASFAGGEISSTNYCSSGQSYTLTVTCGSETAPVITTSGSSVTCSSTITLFARQAAPSTDFADGTYQWYRNGVAISDATAKTYTATTGGVYTVERTKDGCTTVSSNKATITNETLEPEVTRLVPFQYYHKDKTYTEQMKLRHLFAVKDSREYGSTERNFKMELSKNGDPATDVTSSNAFVVKQSDDHTIDTILIDLNKLATKYAENDELEFTCYAVECGGTASALIKSSITMHVIGSTPTLALICSGADGDGTRTTKNLVVGGDFLTGYNKADLCVQTGNTTFDASQEWGLYTKLKNHYIVTPVNGYAEFNKLNYEPFDVLLLTDYPKSSRSEAAQVVIDDMAALCDYRPLLSFKTHFQSEKWKKPNEDGDSVYVYTKWTKKGFTTPPVVTKSHGKLNLNIVCYAHPMFDAIKRGEHVYRDNSDQSQLVYTMLTGEGHEGKKGMQGFEIDAAENFVTIGLTHFNATIATNNPSTGLATWTPGDKDRMLVTVAERQANLEARMILFSLNCGAQSKLTAKGDTVVMKCLEYLISDAANPLTPKADCSFTFDNGAGAPHNADWYKDEENCPGCSGELGDGLWTTEANWGPDRINEPGEFTSVRIAASVEVDDTHAHVLDVRVVDGGSITIPAGKALEVKGTIRHLDGSEISPTGNDEISIGSASTGNGTLIFNNNTGDTKARVAMYSNAPADIANMSAATSVWQYIGTPHTDVANARSNYYGSWIYQYGSGTWEVIPNGGPLEAFRGYCITNENAPIVYDMKGTLAATTLQDISIPAGYTVIANSWVAPIDISTFTDDDMENISDKTIYFFNTGTDADGNHGTGTEAGTYVAVPKNSASYVGTWQIPSMQGFYISTSSAGTLHLDYDRHVRPHSARTIVGNKMYAPRRAATESEEPNVLKIFARGSRYQDKLVVLEREDFTRGYDSGWDGEAWGGGTLSPMVYVTGEGREDAVSAIPEFEGTVIAFKAGEDSEYRLDFVYDGEESLYLLDIDNNTYTQIMTGNAYAFTTNDKSAHSRFVLTRKAPQIATGIEPTSDSSLKGRAKKLLIDDKMYILLNGTLYDATGKMVK